MKRSSLLRFACAASLVVAGVVGLTACSSDGSSSTGEGYTGGVAATVNGTEIAEDAVTEQIQTIRTQMSIDSEDAWGEWLVQYDYTPEGVREDVIDSLVDQELIRQGAAEKGVTVESEDVDSYVNSMKANYDSEEAWNAALKSSGTTEEAYRENLEFQILTQNLYATFASTDDPAEEDVISYSNLYSAAFDGAKRSSHILFAADDEETAQSVLDQINAGELDFVDAVKEYSTDSAATEQDGDVGWDKLATFDTAYQEALDGLEKGQVSELVTSSFGIHIIKCTDTYTAPEEITSTDQVPEEFLEQIESMVRQSNQNQAYQDWFAEYKEAAEIVINDMPEGLPYYVDLAKYETEDDEAADSEDGSSEAEGEDDSDASSEGDASDEGSSDGAADDSADADGEASDSADSGEAADSNNAETDGDGADS